MLSQLSDGLPSQVVLGVLSNTLGDFFTPMYIYIYNVNPFWLIYLFESSKQAPCCLKHLKMKGCFFCSSIYGFDPMSKGRSFLPSWATRKNPLDDKLLFFSPYMRFTTYNQLGQGILVGFTGGSYQVLNFEKFPVLPVWRVFLERLWHVTICIGWIMFKSPTFFRFTRNHLTPSFSSPNWKKKKNFIVVI